MLSKITLSHKAFIILIIAIHAAYFISALVFQHIYTPDSAEYLLDAVNIKEHLTSYSGYWNEVKIPELYTLRPPLYGLFILIAKALINSNFFVIFIQNIFSLGLCLYISKLFKDSIYTLKVNLFIFGSLLFFPTYLIMVNNIMADFFLTFWLALALFFFERFIKTQKSLWVLFYNIAIGAAVMVKPVMMFFWLPNFFIAFYLFSLNRKITLILYSLILPLVIFLWCERNKNVTGYFHFSSIEMQDILEINAGRVLNMKYDTGYSKAFQHKLRHRADSITDFSRKSEFIISSSEDIVMKNLPLYVYAHLRGMFNLMLATGRNDQICFFSTKESAPVSLIYEIDKSGYLKGIFNYLGKINLLYMIIESFVLIWNLFTLVILILSIFSGNMNKVMKIFVYIITGYLVFACGPGGDARFKTSILPFVFYIFPYGWEVIAGWVRLRNKM